MKAEPRVKNIPHHYTVYICSICGTEHMVADEAHWCESECIKKCKHVDTERYEELTEYCSGIFLDIKCKHCKTTIDTYPLTTMMSSTKFREELLALAKKHHGEEG